MFCGLCSELHSSNKVLLERLRVSLVRRSHTCSCGASPAAVSITRSPPSPFSVVLILKCVFLVCFAAQAGERGDHRRLLPCPVPHRARAEDLRAEGGGGVPDLPNRTRERTLRSRTCVSSRQGRTLDLEFIAFPLRAPGCKSHFDHHSLFVPPRLWRPSTRDCASCTRRVRSCSISCW